MNPISSILDLGRVAIERIWPDANKRAEQMAKLEELHQQGRLAELSAEVQLLTAQAETNKIEAAHASLFVSGWRPFIGWTAGIALFTYYVPYALVALFLWAHSCITTGEMSPRPDLDIGELMALLGAMLGVIVPRHRERMMGAALDTLGATDNARAVQSTRK